MLANGLGISEDRWVVACAKLEAAGALVRTLSRLDRRSLIHTVVNPVRTVPDISWVRIRIGMLMDCAPLVSLGGAPPDAVRLWARISVWQGNKPSTRGPQDEAHAVLTSEPQRRIAVTAC